MNDDGLVESVLYETMPSGYPRAWQHTDEPRWVFELVHDQLPDHVACWLAEGTHGEHYDTRIPRD